MISELRQHGPLISTHQSPLTNELRRWDLNPRDTAYETVLASRLQSTPQYSRQDSNLRCALCERAAVAAGPREYSFSIFDFRLPRRFPPTQSKFENQKSKIKNPVVSAGFEPAISTMSGWRALRCSTRLFLSKPVSPRNRVSEVQTGRVERP